MSDVRLEHVNISVKNAQKTALDLCTLFDWHVRWEGNAGCGAGYTYHVGNDVCYIALYTPNTGDVPIFRKSQPLNHIALVVDDLDKIETRVKVIGHTPFAHDDYEPGRRFYFFDENMIEFEVVSYA